MRHWAMRFAIALAASAVACFAYSHELPENRATFILRDDNHVSLTLYLNLPEVLRRALAPQRSFAEFVLVYSAMDAARFKAAVEDAEARMRQATAITDGTGRAPAVQKWAWPRIEDTHSELQSLAAQLLLAPNQPPHDDPAEVHADLVTFGRTESLRASFPQEFDRVLAVSYRPKQVWVETGTKSPEIQF